jgi:hypothetical protein
MRFFPIVLLLLVTPVHAQTVYLNYGQWEQLPTDFRWIYVAGAFDALSVVTVLGGLNAAAGRSGRIA